MTVQALHDHPAIYPHLPARDQPATMPAPDDPAWRSCWEFVLTHELTARERSAFWHGASLAHQAATGATVPLMPG